MTGLNIKRIRHYVYRIEKATLKGETGYFDCVTYSAKRAVEIFQAKEPDDGTGGMIFYTEPELIDHHGGTVYTAFDWEPDDIHFEEQPTEENVRRLIDCGLWAK